MYVVLFLCFVTIQSAITKETTTDVGNSLDVNILKYGIGCRLAWVPCQNGKQLPDFSVFVDESSKLLETIDPKQKPICRTKLFGRHVVGSLHSDGFAYFYSHKEGQFVKKSKYEVLTNPKNCSLNWVFMSQAEESTKSVSNFTESFIRTGNNQDNYIGRRVNSADGFEVCDVVYGSSPTCLMMPSNPMEKENIENFQILQSFTAYLSFTVNNISFAQSNEILTTTLTGYDKIINKADVDVSSSVSYGISKSKGFGLDLSVTASGGRQQNSISGTIGGSIDRDASEDFDVSRDINVPPLTSVESCSTQTIPNLVITFEANATFFIDGIEANTIKMILIQEHFPGPFIINDDNLSVTTIVRGEVNGVDGPVESIFYLNPIAVLDGMSCHTLSKKVNVERRQRIMDQLNSQSGDAILNQRHLNDIISKAYGAYGSMIMSLA